MKQYVDSLLKCVSNSYLFLKNQIIGFIKDRKKKKDFFSDNLFNDETERPARILTTEEINNMISKQALYAESHPNINEYNIIKNSQEVEDIEKSKAEAKEDIDKIKNEIEDFQFEEDEDNNEDTDIKDEKKLQDLKNNVLD